MSEILLTAVLAFIFGLFINSFVEMRKSRNDDCNYIVELIKQYADLVSDYWSQDYEELISDKEAKIMSLGGEIQIRIQPYYYIYKIGEHDIQNSLNELTHSATSGEFQVKGRSKDLKRAQLTRNRASMLISRILKMRNDLCPRSFFF